MAELRDFREEKRRMGLLQPRQYSLEEYEVIYKTIIRRLMRSAKKSMKKAKCHPQT